jgi:hypothetical protein
MDAASGTCGLDAVLSILKRTPPHRFTGGIPEKLTKGVIAIRGAFAAIVPPCDEAIMGLPNDRRAK